MVSPLTSSISNTGQKVYPSASLVCSFPLLSVVMGEVEAGWAVFAGGVLLFKCLDTGHLL